MLVKNVIHISKIAPRRIPQEIGKSVCGKPHQKTTKQDRI